MSKEIIVSITDLNSKGEGVGVYEGKVQFVPGALPGEKVQILRRKEGRRYDQIEAYQKLSTSKARQKPICPLFGQCGGCQLMHWSYEEQLKWKQQRVQQALQRIAKVDVAVAPCEPSPKQLHYRNKVHLHQGGFYQTNSQKVIPVENCFLLEDEGLPYLPQAKSYEDFIIKVGGGNQEVMTVKDGQAFPLYIEQNIAGLTFRVGPKDFFQVNCLQAEKLYQTAIENVLKMSPKKVLDAYCGVGTLSLLAAQHFDEVVGIESGKAAIQRAKENAKLNQVCNAHFICAQVEKKAKSLSTFDAAFLNPPRGGLKEEVKQMLCQKPLDGLVYISCDPATLSRDLAELKRAYNIQAAYPFDLFPQTTHVETLVVLKKNQA